MATPFSTLPTTVQLSGVAVPIRSDFRQGIKFEQLMVDPRPTPAQKLRLALIIWYGEPLPDAPIEEMVDRMLWFYRCGKDTDAAVTPDVTRRVFDYHYDFDLLYAAFKQTYDVDLFEEEYLHWWRFRAMFMALPKETQLMQVVGIRAMDISHDMPKETRRYYRRMKALYRLPDSATEAKGPKTEEEHDAMIAEIVRLKDAQG